MATMEHDMAAVEARASAALGGMSGPDTLIVGGAALYLVVGDILLGLLLGAGNFAGALGGLGGATGIATIGLTGILAGEVLLFAWLSRPTSKTQMISTSAARTAIAIFVVAIVLVELSELVGIVKNLSPFFNSGFSTILLSLCHIVGAAAMGLGVVSAWSPTPATPAAARKA